MKLLTDLLNKMEAAHADSAKLHAELKAGVAIESLIPGAFDSGSVRTKWTSRWPHKEREDFTVVLIDSSGKETTVIGHDIPQELFDSARPALLKEN